MSPTPWRVAYVLKRFPRISETFILTEILELERQGVPIEIFALLEPAEEIRHETLKDVRAHVTYLPKRSHLKHLPVRDGQYATGVFVERPVETLFQDEALAESALFLKAAVLAAMAQAKGVSHLHAHFGTDATTVAMLASRLTRIPYSFTAHAKDIYDERVDQALLKDKIVGARFVVTVSEYNRQHLAALVGEDQAGKVVRLYNGVDLNRFKPDPSVHREPHVILAVGRLVEKKGFRDLVQACRFLLDGKQGCTCLIVGEGPERAALQQQIYALGLQDHVSLLGVQPQERVVELLRRATVLVAPCVVSATGDRDGLPTVLLEALAVGLPAISTDVVGIPELIEHGQTGLLVLPGDPVRLAHAITEVLINPELRDRLELKGRSKVEELFDIKKNALLLRELFASSAVSQEGIWEPIHEDRLPLGR